LTGGRGGMKFDLALHYDSNIYDVSNTLYSLLVNVSSSGGWRYNIANYKLELEERTLLPVEFNPPICDFATMWNTFRLYRLRIGLPDGSMHILHLEGYSMFTDGAYGTSPSGTSLPDCFNGGNLVHSGLWGFGENPPWHLTYYTVDGSFLKVEIDAYGTSLTDWEQREWRLYYPDGRVVVGTKDQVSAIYDANGNKIEIVRVIDETGVYTKIRFDYDYTREIVIQHGYDQTETITRDKITAQGPNGPVIWYIDGNDKGVVQVQLPLEEPVGIGTTPPTHNSYVFDYGGVGIPSLSIAADHELIYVRTPSGSFYEYEYLWDVENGLPLPSNAVTEKKITHDGEELIWSYAYYNAPAVLANAVVTNPDGGQSTYYHSPTTNYSTEDLGPAAQGLVYRIDGPNGSVVKRNWKYNEVIGIPCGWYTCEPYQNFYVSDESVTVGNASGQPSKSAVTHFIYDKNGNLTSKTEYDWVDYAGNDYFETGTTIKRKTDFN
jgi:hypothetical protein